jgi:hypothetical protein
MPSNQWGDFYVETGGQVPSPNRKFDVETVPSPPTFNANNGISSTENFLENGLQPESIQQGEPLLTSTPVIAGTGPQTFYAGVTK